MSGGASRIESRCPYCGTTSLLDPADARCPACGLEVPLDDAAPDAPVPAPSAAPVTSRCPRCGRTVAVDPADPVCPECGYTGREGALPPAAPPTAAPYVLPPPPPPLPPPIAPPPPPYAPPASAPVASQCPRCGAMVSVDAARPVCPACGFGHASATPPPPAYAAPQPPVPGQGLALASLILGIAGLIVWPFALVLGPLALTFGILALRKLKGEPRRGPHRGFAVAGISTGSVGLVIGLLFTVLFVALLSSDWGFDDSEKVGPASCQDDHVLATLTAVETSGGDLVVRVELESRDRFGALNVSNYEDDEALEVESEDGTFSLTLPYPSPRVDAQATRSYDFVAAGEADALDGGTWRSFALSYYVEDGHDRGEADGFHVLTCSLRGDDVPDTLLA